MPGARKRTDTMTMDAMEMGGMDAPPPLETHEMPPPPLQSAAHGLPPELDGAMDGLGWRRRFPEANPCC